MDQKTFRAYIQAEHDKALEELVKNKYFRFYAAELMGFCKTFENAFDEKGNVAAFQNGKQAVGQKIFNDIMMVSPEAYVQMCKDENEKLALRNQMTPKKKEDEEDA